MKVGFETVLEELRGLRDDVKIARQARRVDIAEAVERLEHVETDVKKTTQKVNSES